MLRKSESQPEKEVITRFRKLIKDTPIIRMYLRKMIDQVPGYYKDNPGDGYYLESIEEMLELINKALYQAPKFNETGLVGFPINAILDWTMGMPAGFSAFRLDKINEIFKDILDEYGSYLDSKDSAKVIDPDPEKGGWMSEAAIEAIHIEDFIHDPFAPHWGFTSWNKFFIRQFKAGKRPVADPDNNKVIVSACESEVYAIKDKVKEKDWFWVKSQPYSLQDMLARDKTDNRDEHDRDYVKPFIGGTVYQAFLSALKYHRWHSPVSGTIEKVYIVPGTYYSEAESEGMDPAGPNDSQGYIAHVAARGIIYIKADDPTIGLMCAIFIGMAEVSSCVFLLDDDKTPPQPGQHIEKGAQLGYFQYGGSSHCLVFRPGVFPDTADDDRDKDSKTRKNTGFVVKEHDNVLVRAKIAEAK
jgi:phosphatidylserine decarboxylase